jgi:hypothetical protein
VTRSFTFMTSSFFTSSSRYVCSAAVIVQDSCMFTFIDEWAGKIF